MYSRAKARARSIRSPRLACSPRSEPSDFINVFSVSPPSFPQIRECLAFYISLKIPSDKTWT